ncbi:MAG: DNA mismatch repair endonuclease MutL [Deltaproteobacteria bacterium]|nr:DNA mismatch repair endonuclease MutL [Deltaproteobacteria bacterium]TLN01859.1 MAG: DNA mismatch repair endonuclease MutL [bacterium]
MSSRIKILPENLTNKIAAGEVVERPASVIKELVENALDAGADEIVVEFQDGGKRLIKVIDNGSGMSREDALLALERHATSKIASDDDLLSISTLGFRGEALPSIASVSRFSLSSREKGSIEGTEIYGEGGRIKEVKACGMAEGTVFEIRNLFFNTPARLKFLKSKETEAGHVADQVTRLALSRPDVRFSCVSDGRTLFRALNGDMAERVAALLGRSLAADLYPVGHQSNGLSLSGLAGKPECSRSAGSHLYTFVNGRFVRDRVFQHAVLQAYRRFLERGRYPVAVLFLSVPAGDVDVNVHPTKHEVRFRDQSSVHDFIVSSLEDMLQSTPWIRQASVAAVAPATVRITPSEARVASVRESLGRYQPKPVPEKIQETLFSPERRLPESTEASVETSSGSGDGFFASLTVLGRYLDEYLLCQDGDDLLIIDQHAAHERVAFERLRSQLSAGAVESQGLLFPEVVELSHSEAALVAEHAAVFRQLGFDLEDFGGQTRVLKGVPRILVNANPARALSDIIEELAVLGRSRTVSDIQEDILMRIACHSVIRGRQLLSGQEIAALLAALDSVGFASNCPHGRPVLRRISRSDIEKMFKRV